MLANRASVLSFTFRLIYPIFHTFQPSCSSAMVHYFMFCLTLSRLSVPYFAFFSYESEELNSMGFCDGIWSDLMWF